MIVMMFVLLIVLEGESEECENNGDHKNDHCMAASNIRIAMSAARTYAHMLLEMIIDRGH